MIKKNKWGTLDQKEVFLFSLENEFIKAKISNFGAIITRLEVKNKFTEFQNIVLGFDKLSDYQSVEYKKQNPHFGGIIGRFANRIEDGKFKINGKQFQLPCNENNINHIHGGKQGFDSKVWTSEIVKENNTEKLRLSYLSIDGDENYPGNLTVSVDYYLNNNQLVLEYSGKSDQDTLLNLTNHTYFNLSNSMSKVLDNKLFINSKFVLKTNEKQIPNGEKIAIEQTPFDFSVQKQIHSGAGTFRGFDHTYVLEKGVKTAPDAKVLNTKSGISMSVFTTQPAIQFYTANFLDGTLRDSSGRIFSKYSAFCLEDQFFPDAPNLTIQKNAILKAGEQYFQKTIWEFEVI